MNLAIRDIRANFLKFVLTALGVGLLLMAARSMAGLYRGIVYDALEVIEESGADLWVVQAGTEGPFAEASVLDRTLADRTRGVPGVGKARQFELVQKRFQVAGSTIRGSLLGLDFPEDRGEWLPLVAGRSLSASTGEALGDPSMGLRLGDPVTVGRTTCRVVGLMRGLVDASGNPILVASLNDVLEMESWRPSESVLLERAAGLPVRSAKQGKIAAVMVNLDPGARESEVVAAISRWGDVAVLTRAQERDAMLLGRLDKLRTQILMFLVTLLIVSGVVVSVTIYTMTMEKTHEIALLKLIGARNSVIINMIVQQSLLMGGLAFLLALGAGRLLNPLFPRRLVQLPADTLLFALVVLLICGAGSALGILKAMGVRAQEVLS
ncbi:ABC transporter permease [Mesoterricola silvestris]|uniref:ABC transporter permease n=1 Tax=Mesoterricola silvestris TaxID=2927979 RepID=A0AA48K8Q4_9BACT|nr:ABC transporter permease [Mesoterricola silvestris]BDU71527.1 ABC transporter permease [Mesoterricola silvestris]